MNWQRKLGHQIQMNIWKFGIPNIGLIWQLSMNWRMKLVSMHNISLATLTKSFAYLDKLRESGNINMFCSPTPLARDLNLSLEEANQIWNLWAGSFGDGTAQDRAKEVKRAFAA